MPRHGYRLFRNASPHLPPELGVHHPESEPRP
jgi:hypothetical protein